jgi:MFS family permease
VLAAAWGGNHYSPLLLLYRQVDGYSQVQVDLFFAFYIIGLTPGFLLSGPLADRYGRKRPVLAALALGVLGSTVLALGSASVWWMCTGRLISGVSVAVAMVAGTSWIKELSQHDAVPQVRARRAALTLTAGFGLGAGVSGALAQWGPHPTLLPYLVQIALSLAAVPPLLRTPETGTPAVRPLFGDLRIPAAGRRRFRLLILPMAPWVFAAPALSFVIAPALVAQHTSTHRIAFAALLAVITLCSGAAVQPLVPRLPRAPVLGLTMVAAGTAVLAVHPAVATAVAMAVLFGLGYGICIVSGLVAIQAMANPANLAGLTGIYYSLTYLGFVLPVLLATLNHLTTYPVLLTVVALVCLACAAVTARAIRS